MKVWTIAALALAPAVAFSAVDSDCFWGKESIACALDRVDDAKVADTLVEPVLAKAGWKHGCYRVLFIKGDNGGPDTLLVAVDGPRGGSAPGCTTPVVEGLTPAETKRILDRGGTFQDVMKATSEKSIRKGEAEAATEGQLRDIGLAIKKAILASPEPTKSRLLRKTRQLVLGSGYGAEYRVSLP
jgi:hypothetical protein